jgi:hypothetical protein
MIYEKRAWSGAGKNDADLTGFATLILPGIFSGQKIGHDPKRAKIMRIRPDLHHRFHLAYFPDKK